MPYTNEGLSISRLPLNLIFNSLSITLKPSLNSDLQYQCCIELSKEGEPDDTWLAFGMSANPDNALQYALRNASNGELRRKKR